jgi:hypothetical protein
MQPFQRFPLGVGETFDGASMIQSQFKEWRLLWVRPREGAAAHGATATHNVMRAVASDDNWEAAKRQFSVENDCGGDPGGWLCDAKRVIDSLSEYTKVGTAGEGDRQGLTLVHFSAQLELWLSQENTLNTLNTPLTRATQPLRAPPIP